MQSVKCKRRERGILHPVEALKGKKRSGFTLLSGRMCNYECPHCLTESGTDRREFAKPGMVRKIMKSIKPIMGTELVSFIAISGGEPFLNLDFIEEVIKQVGKVCADTHVPMPRLPIVTNGTISGPAIYKILEPVKDKMYLYYSPDEFHPKASGIAMFEGRGFKVDTPGAGKKLAALGRAYSMEGKHNWKMDCDASGVIYGINGSEVTMLKRNVTTSKFMVLENGDVKLCGWGGLTFGNLEKETTFDIAERIEKDEMALALMEKGPLGLAEVLGKTEAAIEILRSKGSCGVCHALSRNLI